MLATSFSARRRPRKPDEGQPVRIAFVITGLHGVAGGAERVLTDVANGLCRRGYDITVITDQDTNGPPFYPLEYGIRRLDGRRRDGRSGEFAPARAANRVAARGGVYALGAWALRYGPKIVRLRRMLRIAQPNVCIAFLPSSFPYIELASVGLQVRTVASLHNVPDRDLGGDAHRWDQNPVDIRIRRRGLRTADATTVLLPSFVQQLEPDVRDRTFVVPNLVHQHEGPIADVRTDELDNTILAVGRLSPAKDHLSLVEAWSLLEERYPAWRVRIIGDGPLKAQLVDRICDLGLRRVTIDEPTAEIGAAYSSAKIFAMPSRYEGFGLVTVEAMAAGLPVVGFADCEGTNEIVSDNHTGLLVDPGNDRPSAFATGLARLIDDTDERRRLAQNGPAAAQQFDDDDSVLDSWEHVVHNVLGAGG